MVQTPVTSQPRPDPGRTEPFMLEPAARRGVLTRRAVAYLIDLAIIGVLWLAASFVVVTLSIVSFGLLSPSTALLLLVPAAYHVLTVGLQGATWGQALLGLTVCDRAGGRPALLQALVLTAAFYLTVPTTGGLALLAVFFIPGRRTLHDALSGTVVVRRDDAPAVGWVR